MTTRIGLVDMEIPSLIWYCNVRIWQGVEDAAPYSTQDKQLLL